MVKELAEEKRRSTLIEKDREIEIIHKKHEEARRREMEKEIERIRQEMVAEK